MTLPATMMAIDPAADGGPEVLVPIARPVPRPGPGEVLLRIAAAGVNRPDLMQREGKYPPPPGAPSIPGLEISGEVAAIGDADGSVRDQAGDTNGCVTVGGRVCALVAGGGYAEYAVADAALCLPLADSLTMVEAAALPETLFTVWSNVFQRGRAQAGETLLVHGGTSGIGTMAIKLGRLFGLTVIVTAGGPEKCRRALEIGAAHAIDYRAGDFVAGVQAATGARGVDLVLDMIGGDYLPRNLQCLATEGRHVSIAVQRGGKGELPIWQVMQKRLTLTGSTLRARDPAFKAALAADIRARVWPMVLDGRLRPEIDRTFPLAQAAEAHRHLEAGGHVGKVVLKVG